MVQLEGWRIGEATVTPIYETDAGSVIQPGMVDATPERLAQVAWLAPRFADASGRMRGVVQGFVVRIGDRTVLVDACVGNGKPRPGLPAWSELRTDFPQRLSTSGVEPESIDTVVCTHFHFDHVGWNTVQRDGAWAPHFLRARYLFSEPEFAYWRTLPERETADDLAGVQDSVLPIVAAGLADLVPPDHEIAPGLRLYPTHGHTPGHVSVLLESAGERAVITGDAVHHPSQLAHPEWGIFSDFDPAAAYRTRVALFSMCADTGTLLIGSHFAPPAAVRVKRVGEVFAVE